MADADLLDLEEIEGEAAMAWVKAQNALSLARLQGDPRYEGLYQETLKLLEASDRIAAPTFHRLGERRVLTNFWQDATHVRGLWRRTSLESYRMESPEWETILDLDALAASEGRNWVFHGAEYLEPEENLSLVALSDGGKDADMIREFDLAAKGFVEGGFHLPESKGGAVWLDKDHLLIDRDFGPDSLTDSGYPRTLRLLKRGQKPEEAEILFEAERTDVFISVSVLRDPEGAVKAVLIRRARDFHCGDTYLWRAGEPLRLLALPEKGGIAGLLHGRAIASTNEDWTAPSGQSFKAGDLFSWDFDAWLADPAAPATLILSPGPRESVEGMGLTRNRLVLALYENVRGSVYVYSPEAGGGWSRARLDTPQNVSVGLRSTSDWDDQAFLQISGYLTPSSLWLADLATGATELVKSTPARFDATGLTVAQYEAPSADGTLIPYFVVRRENAPLDGSNPTLLYGYGGFQTSLLPGYGSLVGKLWLEQGGVYASANTRGGGEFGPKWHQAALRENRQRAHEDFQAVAEDLIRRGITSPARLGIEGGSQGGLLMGVTLTQRPDLINAAVISVPLFDMLRFHKLLAGASWVAEYGDPEIPAERAWIEAYSPYQQLCAGKAYPEVFIHTSTKDDRVHPGHARRAAARLEELGYPALFYENTDGGHNAAANLRETARISAMEQVYLRQRLMDPPFSKA